MAERANIKTQMARHPKWRLQLAGLVVLVMLVRNTVSVRDTGLWPHPFTSEPQPSIIPDEQGPFSSPQQLSLPSSITFSELITDTLTIFPNGFVHVGDTGAAPLEPTDVQGVLLYDDTFNILAPLMVVNNVNHRFSFRVLDCSDTAGREYVYYDCTRASYELAAMLAIDPTINPVTIFTMVIITWQLYLTTGDTVYVQTIIADLGMGGDPTDLFDAAYFVYQLEPYPELEDASQPFVGVRYGLDTAGLNLCYEGVPVLYQDFCGDKVQGSSISECGNPGVFFLPMFQIMDAIPPGLCLDIVKETRTCSESLFCRQLSASEWQLNLQVQYSPVIFYIPVDSVTGGYYMEEECVTFFQGGSTAVTITVDPDQPPHLNDCGYFIDVDAGLLTVTAVVLQDYRRVQKGDLLLSLTCHVTDIPYRTGNTISAGDVSMFTALSKQRVVDLSIVQEGGIPLTSPCTIGESLFLQLTLTNAPDDDPEVSVKCAYATECVFYNNPEFLDDSRLLDGRDVAGNPNGLKVMATGVRVIVDGCLDEALVISDDSFKLATPDGGGYLDGFRRENSASALQWVMRTGGFECAGFKQTARVYAKCRVEYGADPWGNGDRCDDACSANNGLPGRRRRRSAGRNSHTVTANWTVGYHYSTDESSLPVSCVDRTTANSVILVLVTCIILALCIATCGIIRVVRRPKVKKNRRSHKHSPVYSIKRPR